jgi:MATE family multidrug resistance protein
MIVLSSLRFQIPWLFTSEEDVVALAAAVLPVNAAFQLFDALAAICNGCLRGLGKQEVGGYINLFAYYVVSSSPAAPFAPPIPKPVFISLAPDANLLISIR